MIGGKTNSGSRPTALGSLLNASTYGMTIPTYHGTTRGNVLAIWAAHLREGHSDKKSKKKGVTTYVENVDFLVGSNPIEGALQVWANNSNRYTMNFVKLDVPANTATGGLGPYPFIPGFTIADSHFYFILAVTADRRLSGSFADYGSNVPPSGVVNASASNFGLGIGTGYVVGDTFSISGPTFGPPATSLAVGRVLTIGAGGTVTGAVAIDDPGSGYSGGLNVPCTTLTGSGTGLEVDIFVVGTPHYDGIYELPLWNTAQHGPNLTNPSMMRNWPFLYYWTPDFGNIFYIPGGASNNYDMFDLDYHVYYAQLTAQTKHQPPITRVRLTFEDVLGNGDEYSDAGLSSQQILYPTYAGLESSDIDLGASGMLPDLRIEIKGSNAVNPPRGDADFADMIEDTMMSGQLQVGAELGLIQRGLNCVDIPGLVQRNFDGNLEPHTPFPLVFYQPNAAGSIILAFYRWRASGGSNATISDSAGDTWTTIFVSANSIFAYATAIGGNGNVVTGVFNGGGFAFDSRGYLMEMDPGSNEVLAVDTSQGGSAGNPQTVSVSVTVTQPCFLLLAGEVQNFSVASIPPHWENIALDPLTGIENDILFKRYVSAPGTYTFSLVLHSGLWNLGLIAMGGQPSPLPKSLGNIIDDTTMQLTRLQCRANGLWGSIVMDSQRTASDWLKEFYQCANAAPVWSGFVLKSIPLSEVSAVGNGVVYISPTAAGPVAILTEGDLIGDSSTLIEVDRVAQVDTNNIIQIEHVDRNNDYNVSTASQPESGAIALFGPRKQSPISLHEIQDPAIARKILAIAVRRMVLLRNTYKFKMQQKWIGLEAMDLVLINDSQIGLINFPVRLTKITENDTLELECEAEPFIYGLNDPDPLLVATDAAPNNTNAQYVPGPINPPILVEIPLRMSASGDPELWAVVSDSDPRYGGSFVYVSVDGGTSYSATPVGVIHGNATTGYLTADWPASPDPDATNDLSVDLTESNGVLASYSAQEENAFLFPNFVAASPGPSPSFFGGSGAYGGLEPSQAVAYAVTAAPFNILACATRGGGVAVWFNPKIPSGVTRFYTDITLDCGPNIGGFVIDAPGGHNCACVSTPCPCGFGCSALGPCTAIPPQGCFTYSPYSGPGDIPAGPSTFNYDFENIVVGIADGGKIVGISNTNILNEVTFSLSLWGSAAIYIFEIAPISPGNPHLYVAITFGGPGPTPAGWTKVVTGANVFSAYTQLGVNVDPPGSNYELMTYQGATLTAPFMYTMPATAPAPLRRAVFGLPFVGLGEDHAMSSRFAWLDAWQNNPSPLGILKMKLDPTWINRELFFKFVQFNSIGGGIADLADAVPYPYTPVGVQAGGGTTGGGTGTGGQPGQTTYQVTGGALTNPTDTTIHMDQASVLFSNGSAVNYNARTITIASPTQPTDYFVTIFDPSLLGEAPGTNTLTAQASLTQQFVGLPGYIYIGSITVLPGGGGSVTTPGGFPTSEQITVNGI